MANYQSNYTGAQIDTAVGNALSPDTTLAVAGKTADAKAAGDRIGAVEELANSDNKKLNELWFTCEINSSGGYLTSTDTIATEESTHCKYTNKIQCEAGQKFKYKGVGEYSAVSYIYFLNDTIVSSGQVNSADRYTEITIPSGVNFVKFASYAINAVAVVLDVYLISDITESDKSNIRGTLDVYSKDETADIFISKQNVQSLNLFDKTNIVTGEYLSGKNVLQAAGYGHTDWIYLEAGTYIFPTNTDYGGNKTTIQLSLDGETYYSYINATLFSDSELAYFTLGVARWIRFNIGIYVVGSIMLVEGDEISDYPSEYIPYYNYNQVEENIHLNNTMKEEIADSVILNPLLNKKITANGDSICWGNGYRGGYAKIISDNNDMRYQNIAVGGGTLTAGTYSGETARHWVSRTISNMDTDSDYVLIEGGVNDASLNVTLGAITAGYTDTLDDTTFYGAVESIFKQVITRFIGKKYCFIIPHQMTAGMKPNGNYYNAIYECATKWGMPILDLSKDVPPFNSFRSDTTLDNIRTTYTTDGDGWHPTELCYNKYYVPKIESFLRTL